jgi:chemotaxis protein MotA
MFANLVFIPMANKLSVRSEGETLARYMMLEGITSIQSGENPSVLEERLKIFLPPSRRDDVEEGGGGEEE